MLTQLCCILRNGLQGNTDKVRGYAELIVKQYYNEKATILNATEDEKIAKVFKDILENNPSSITLDENIPKCRIYNNTGFYTIGGSFGSSSENVKCHCKEKFKNIKYEHRW